MKIEIPLRQSKLKTQYDTLHYYNNFSVNLKYLNTTVHLQFNLKFEFKTKITCLFFKFLIQ